MAEMPAFGCANMSHSQNRASIAPPIESRLLDGCDSCDIDAIERNCTVTGQPVLGAATTSSLRMSGLTTSGDLCPQLGEYINLSIVLIFLLSVQRPDLRLSPFPHPPALIQNASLCWTCSDTYCPFGSPRCIVCPRPNNYVQHCERTYSP